MLLSKADGRSFEKLFIIRITRYYNIFRFDAGCMEYNCPPRRRSDIGIG